MQWIRLDNSKGTWSVASNHRTMTAPTPSSRVVLSHPLSLDSAPFFSRLSLSSG